MYNQEQKGRFVDRLNEVAKLKAHQTFTKTEASENDYDMDCSLFNIGEIATMYKSWNIKSLDTMMTFHSILRSYTDFCMSEGLLEDGVNHYKEIGHYDLSNYISSVGIRKRILTREEVYGIAEKLENPLEKVYFCGAFEGMVFGMQMEMYTISSSKIVNGIYTTNSGRKMKVPEALVKYIKAAEEADCLILHDARGKSMPFKSNYPPVFKQMYNARMYTENEEVVRYFNRILVRMCRDYGLPNINTKDLHESGRISMIKSFMTADKSDDIRETIAKHLSEIEEQYGELLSVNRFMAKYEKSFTKD